jgi:uncharacterized LabA/DUF88 family protein
MSTAKEIKYLFIDGACLDNILIRIGKELFNGDKVDLVHEYLGGGYDKVFYYDALPRKNKGESEADFADRLSAKEHFLNNLKVKDKFHVYEGVVLERRQQLNQKAVDIMIAVDMLRHSFRKNMDKATLLTGDLDFKPLLDALILEGMYTTLWYDPRITSKELLYSADSNQVLLPSFLYHISTDSFKESHPVPQICAGGDEGQLQKTFKLILSKGQLNSGVVSLLSNEQQDEFCITYYERRIGYRYATFKDYEYLRQWFEYEYNGKIVWRKSI